MPIEDTWLWVLELVIEILGWGENSQCKRTLTESWEEKETTWGENNANRGSQRER